MTELEEILKNGTIADKKDALNELRSNLENLFLSLLHKA